MDEVQGHGGRRADELVKPVNESSERGDPDDTERGLRTGGHRRSASDRSTGAAAPRPSSPPSRTGPPRCSARRPPADRSPAPRAPPRWGPSAGSGVPVRYPNVTPP